ncbi:MAG: sugar phosphate isomerase/epimerase [Acidobacteria bacterium]|nr:sugar phosphate isomerase/epimerase [Acidobacteriota bacterium]
MEELTRRIILQSAAAALVAQTPGFIKGVGTVSFPKEMPFPERCRLAKKYGFGAIEVRCIDDIAVPLDAGQCAEWKRTAANEGITIATLWASGRLYADGAMHDADAARRQKGRDALARAIEAAVALGVDSILVNAVRVGTGPKLMNRYEDVYKRFQEQLRTLIPVCEKHKVRLLVENVGNRFLLSPIEMRSFIDEIRSDWVQVYFDVGNVLLQGYPQDWIPTLGKRIRRIHFKDYKFDSNYAGHFVELGEGDLDWKATMAAIRAIGYRGFIVDEWSAGTDFEQHLDRSSKAMDRILAL